MSQSDFKANACNQRQARENARDQLMNDFSFASHWLRKWRELCRAIIERDISKNESKQEVLLTLN